MCSQSDQWFHFLVSVFHDNAGIISFRTKAASLGGGSDIGRRLSPRGREHIVNAITRNNIELIASENLSDAVVRRLDRYEAQHKLKDYKARQDYEKEMN